MKQTIVSQKTMMRVIITLLVLFAFNTETFASHFRYGNITWKRVLGGGDSVIEFKISQAWRRSFYGAPNVGATVTTDNFYPGVGGVTVPVNLTITSINVAEDWFYGEFVYTKVFPSAAATYNAYTLENCCRISTLSNNADGNFSTKTTVTIGNANDAPISTMPPIVTFMTNTTSSYTIPYIDPNGDAVTFSLSAPGSFGSGTTQPTGVSVSPTGVITFNTIGKPVGSLWNTNITMTDAKGAQTQLDVLLKVVQLTTPPYFDYGVTPGNNYTYIVQPGTPISFGIKALDNDLGDVVSLTAVGVPMGATFSPTNGNPANTTFSWTPTLSQLGTYLINFVATDASSAQANTIVKIVVTARPQFVSPTPGNNSILCFIPGNTISQTFAAQDADTGDRVTLSVVAGQNPGMNFTPNLPVVNANPATASMTWNTTATEWGLHTLVMRATDLYNEHEDDTIHYIVNNPPTVTSTPNGQVNAGQFYTYTITTNDLDIPLGDEVGVESYNIPPFLSFVDNLNGTYTISGTPTLADVGTYIITIELEDEMNHIMGTHCGSGLQTYTLTVVPCNVSSSISVSPSPTIANHQANTIYLGYGAQAVNLTAAMTGGSGPYSYDWTPAASLSSASTQTVSATPTTNTTYTVVITDGLGCKDTNEITIHVVDARCGNNNQKVIVCHVPPGNPGAAHQVCVSPNAVPAHLAHSSCYVGPCMTNMRGVQPFTQDEENSVSDVEIYPNPATDQCMISLPEALIGGEMTVTNLNGAIVSRQTHLANQTQVSTALWAKGMYFIELKNGNTVVHKKLTVRETE